MNESLYDFCRRNGRSGLLDQWDTERNGDDTPRTVSYGSQRKIWWRCEKGHTWQAPVYSRTGGAGCPYCAGKKVGQGNDLTSLYPELAAQWDLQKNAPRKPSDFSAGSQRLVWWRCEKGHSWRAQIRSRVSGCGCPVCADRLVVAGENSLADASPELARQWDAEKNAPLTPQQVTAGTRRKVWWKCARGHSWRASVTSRANQKTGCPICDGKEVQKGFNDLASLYPALAGEWDAAKNGALTPESVTPASNRKVWWRCEKGHSYRAVIAQRVQRGSGCPYCTNRKILPGFNDLATVQPLIARQWHPTLNGGLTPEMVTAGSNRKVWWQCPLGHTWKAVVYSRTGAQRCGCPICAGKGKQKNVRYEEILAESAESSTAEGKADVQRI